MKNNLFMCFLCWWELKNISCSVYKHYLCKQILFLVQKKEFNSSNLVEILFLISTRVASHVEGFRLNHGCSGFVWAYGVCKAETQTCPVVMFKMNIKMCAQDV